MSAIRNQSFAIAHEEACRLWAYCGAQYVENDALLAEVSHQILRSLSVFALNARRVLETFPKTAKFSATSSPWSRKASHEGFEEDLWESLALAIHASVLRVHFAELTDGTYIAGAKVVSHASVSTDRKPGKAISPFGMAYSFLSGVAPQFKDRATSYPA
jgi:hypothetical protein